jgi:DNA-binding NarL/FixJ family response regulator
MPSFVEICRKEWKSWKGPFLPEEVLAKIGEDHLYVGELIVISMFKIHDITLLRARDIAPADQLGCRELEVAQLIAEGIDYKTIAQNLGISPSTVRSHTTNIYSKLGINDKAQLAVELSKVCN